MDVEERLIDPVEEDSLDGEGTGLWNEIVAKNEPLYWTKQLEVIARWGSQKKIA